MLDCMYTASKMCFFINERYLSAVRILKMCRYFAIGNFPSCDLGKLSSSVKCYTYSLLHAIQVKLVFIALEFGHFSTDTKILSFADADADTDTTDTDTVHSKYLPIPMPIFYVTDET